MLNIQEVANFLNDKLNDLSDLGFNVCAEIGKSDTASLINGIIRTAQAKTTPIANYTENRYSFVIELSVPTGRANKVFIKTQEAVNLFVENYDGTKIDFADGSGTINVSLGKPENFKVEYNVGDCTPLYFTIDMVYTESGVMSIQKKWYLNNYEIPFETESVVVNKEGISRKVDFDKYTKTFLTGQTKFYKFKFPYQDTELGNMLMKDILNGDFNKQYTLKYVDGINYIEDSVENPPFETKVSLYMSGDLNSQVVSVGKFDVTFTDVDDGNTQTKYYIALIDWKFDLSGEDTKWFPNQAAQQSYFDDVSTGKVLVANGGTGWQQIQAPNLNSIFITSQVFPNTNKLNIFDLARKNYAIIKVVKNEGALNETKQYIYYGATNCQIGADGQVTYDLEEDTLQTLLYNPNLSIADSFIERCHQDRFVYNSVTGKYYYNWEADSKLFAREEVQSLSKRTTKKEKMTIRYSSNETLNSWLNDNIECWQYAFISPGNYNYGVCDAGGSVQNNHTMMGYFGSGQNCFGGGTLCFCVPIFKTTKKLYIKDYDGSGKQVDVNWGGIYNFFKENGGVSSQVLYSTKLSIMPPFDVSGVYEIDASGNLHLTSIAMGIKTYIGAENNIGVIILEKQNRNSIKLETTQQFVNEFTAADIKSGVTEPKLYNEDYSVYHIYYGGQTYEMPVSKTSNKPVFKYYEILTPDITKFVLSYDNPNSNSPYTNSIFTENSTKDFTGLVGTLDLSMWFTTEALADWLAQNKNNLQIFQNNQKLAVETTDIQSRFGLGASIIGAAGSVMSNQPLGLVGSLLGGSHILANREITEKRLETEAINRELTIDNMRQSPDRLSAVNSNSLFLRLVDYLGIYIELQQPLDSEKQQINDYMKRYGYTLNRLGKLSDYLVTNVTVGNVTTKKLARKNYVYIKAIISALSGTPMSTQERMNLKQRFSNGIRFWDGDNINYSLANYEINFD